MPGEYCKENDLLLTQGLEVSPGDKSKFIVLACNEMDGKLGFVYSVPIDISDDSLLPNNQKKLLTTIASKLATGRLIMGTAIGGQSESVNAYGLFLVKEAMMDLMSIANGDVDLNAPKVDQTGTPIGNVPDPSVEDPFARVPGGWNPDSMSAVTAYEKNFHTVDPLGETHLWDPADNISGNGRNADLRG